MHRRASSSSLYLILIVALSLALRLSVINQSFWLDEAAQAVLSHNPFADGSFSADFQPPLFYYLTHVWIELGNIFGLRSEAFLRLLPVGFGIATIVLLYLFAKEQFGRRVGLVSSLILASSPFHIYYSQEFRMYSMLTFVALLSWYFLRKRQWLGFAIATTISIFTHYFAFFNLAAQIVYILVTERKSVHIFFRALALGLAPFVLWLPVLSQQLDTAGRLVSAWPGWKAISNPGWLKFPGLILAKFTVGMISPQPRILYAGAVAIFGVIVLSAVGIVVVGGRRVTRPGLFFFRPGLLKVRSGIVSMRLNKSQSMECRFVNAAKSIYRFAASRLRNLGPGLQNTGLQHTNMLQNYLTMLVCMTIVPLILVWIAGIWVPASSPWRIQFVLPPLYLLIAVAYLRLWKAPIIISGLVLSTVIIMNITFTLSYILQPDNHRENWRSAIAYTDQLAEDGALVAAEYIDPWAPMIWYSSQQDAYMGISDSMTITQDSIDRKMGQRLPTHDRVVLYTYLFEVSDPERKAESYLVSKGYTLSEEKDFRGVGIVKIYFRK